MAFALEIIFLTMILVFPALPLVLSLVVVTTQLSRWLHLWYVFNEVIANSYFVVVTK